MVVNVVGNVAMNVVAVVNVAMNVVAVVNVADQYWFIQRLLFNACCSTLVVQRSFSTHYTFQYLQASVTTFAMQYQSFQRGLIRHLHRAKSVFARAFGADHTMAIRHCVVAIRYTYMHHLPTRSLMFV